MLKSNKKLISGLELMGLELNRDIVEEVKQINVKLASGELSQAEIDNQKRIKKELNKQRISALGLKLIPGGKYE